MNHIAELGGGLMFLFVAGFVILWPVLIWSHLRTQTELLRQIAKKIK